MARDNCQRTCKTWSIHFIHSVIFTTVVHEDRIQNAQYGCYQCSRHYIAWITTSEPSITVMSRERHSVSNHWQCDCLFKSSCIKENIKAPLYRPFAREIHLMPSGFPSQRVTKSESVYISWRHFRYLSFEKNTPIEPCNGISANKTPIGAKQAGPTHLHNNASIATVWSGTIHIWLKWSKPWKGCHYLKIQNTHIYINTNIRNNQIISSKHNVINT